MKYCVLGPLEVFDGSRSVALNQAKERLLLAILLMNANRVVSTDRLLEDMWGDDQPASGLKALQYHVSKLRDALNPDRKGATGSVLLTRPPGYVLEVADDALDAKVFELLVDEARQLLQTDAGSAKRLLDEAMELWRGAALADFQFADFAGPEIERLEEEKLQAIELLFQAELALGRHDDVIPRLTALVGEHPYREALRGSLITALYRAGRQAEALRSFQDMRKLLGEELGIDPSPELVALEEQVLLQGDSLLLPVEMQRPRVLATTLPAQLTSFIGRIPELSAVSQLLGENRLVTITGTGGSGKTRLALETAAAVLDNYSDGVCFVDLSAIREAGLVDQAIFDATGAAEIPNRSLREALTDHLYERQLLLLLDNCEHVIDATASISAHLLTGTAALSVLATSQQVLRLPGEKVFPIPPLHAAVGQDDAAILESDAGRLFVDRAQTARPEFEPTEADAVVIGDITSQLDGLPLAIELAAARVRMMSLSDIATNLSGRFRLLTDGSRSVERHETLEAAVAWSYELTRGREQRFFDQLSVFAGSFRQDAASEVGSVEDPLDAFELLGGLVDKSLIVIDASGDEMRYRLLETMRIFGSAQLAQRGELEAATDRHATYYLTIVRDGEELLTGPEQGRWQRRFRTAAPDIRRALDHLIEHRPDDSLSAVTGLGRYWHRESANLEGMNWLQRALDTVGPAPSANRANALRWLAGLNYQIGRIDESADLAAQAVAMAREVDDPAGLAASLNMLGQNSMHLGLVREAIGHFVAALIVEEEAGIPRSVALLLNIGMAYLDLGDLEGSERAADRLRKRSRSDDGSATSADIMQCDIAIVRGNLAEARDMAERVQKEYVQLDNRVDLAEIHDRLAEIAVIEGDLTDAREHLARAVELRADLGEGHQVAANLIGAQLALATGDIHQARSAIRLAALNSEQPSIWSRVVHFTSQLALLSGDHLEAAQLTGAIKKIADEKNVTIRSFILEQGHDVHDALADELVPERLKQEEERGAAMDIGDVMALIRRVLS